MYIYERESSNMHDPCERTIFLSTVGLFRTKSKFSISFDHVDSTVKSSWNVPVPYLFHHKIMPRASWSRFCTKLPAPTTVRVDAGNLCSWERSKRKICLYAPRRKHRGVPLRSRPQPSLANLTRIKSNLYRNSVDSYVFKSFSNSSISLSWR